MDNKTDFNISRLMEELDGAVLSGDIEKADEITDVLFRLRQGSEADAVIPAQFPINIAVNNNSNAGGNKVKSKNIRRIVSIAAAAALIAAFSITALATHLFGLRDMVIKSNDTPAVSEPSAVTSDSDTETTAQGSDLIVLQGYPDSNEYKASEEWNVFCTGYDTDHAILNKVGNSSNEYTEKYPLYLVYSQEMVDKLEEITVKYGLKLHESIVIAETPDQLIAEAGVGDFIISGQGGINIAYGGYVYNDGTFHYDGEAIIDSGKVIDYQFGNYVKGTFSDTYLNVGDASSYEEWTYKTSGGVSVSLALGESKALVIVDLNNSFVTVNVLAGTAEDEVFGSDSITKEDLQAFADLFDLSQIN
ncbi:MAG: hypothetical protein AB7C97_11340 [Oscillospiraceae bacterium]